MTGFFPIWQGHFVAECNFIEEHLNANDEIFLLECDAALKSCDANPKGSLLKCATCVGTRKSALNLLSDKVKKLPIKHQDAGNFSCLKGIKFLCQKDLLKFEYQGLDVGKSVISSIVTATGSPFFNTVQNRSLINKCIIDFLSTYFTAIEYLKIYKFDLVYIFNGRFAAPKAWLQACVKFGTEYVTHERIGMPNEVFKFRNGSIHDVSQFGPKIKSFWIENKQEKEILSEAINFFEERPKGKLTGWFSFVSGQKADSLPSAWNSQKRNIVLFASTESEFVGLPEYFHDAVFNDQKKVFLDMVQEINKKHNDFHFYLRIHPNSRVEKDKWWEYLEFRNFANLTILDPSSDVSSYSLLMRCEKTVAFMSTIGIEATYWGKPSIVLSNAMYRGIGAAHEPKDFNMLVDMILEPNLRPQPKEWALAYGAYIRCGSERLKHSESLDHCKLTFKGRRPNAHEKVLKSLWRYENRVNKWPLPAFIKIIWEQFEWYRLRWITRGDFSNNLTQ